MLIGLIYSLCGSGAVVCHCWHRRAYCDVCQALQIISDFTGSVAMGVQLHNSHNVRLAVRRLNANWLQRSATLPVNIRPTYDDLF